MRRPLLLFAGPCCLDSTALETACRLQAIVSVLPVQLIFKSSFDKANRTNRLAQRGPGAIAGLRQLAEIRDRAGVSTITDVHDPLQAPLAAEVCDWLQVPAFLCRQTDLLEAVGAQRKPVLLKRGPWATPGEMFHAREKLRHAGATEVWIGERGTSFGRGELVTDLASVVEMLTWSRVAFDATHSTQRRAAQGQTTGGDWRLAEPLARAALAVGCQGIFLETHLDPQKALSDRESQVPLDSLPALLGRLAGLWTALEGLA